MYYSLNEVGVREKRQAENTANDSHDGLNKRFINDSMARRNDSVSDQRNDVIDFTKYGEKESNDSEYQESDRSRENKNHTDETGRWYGRDIENESLNRNDTSRSSDHENGIEDTVDEKEGASETTSLDDSVAKQLHSKKPTYEEDHINGNETSSNFSGSEDVSDDIENDKEELADRKSVNSDSKQMHPTTKISNEERGSGALKGSETSSSLSGGEDPNGDIDNKEEELSGRKSVGNDAKQMLSKKKISDDGRSRDALNDKEASSSLFDNEEYTENNARDEGEPINEAKQVYSKRPALEKGYDSEAMNGKEMSSSFLGHEEKNGGHPNLKYSNKESRRKFQDDNSAKQLRSEKRTLEVQEHPNIEYSDNESKRTFQDESGAKQFRSEKRILEEDTDLEALNGNDTTTNVFHNDKQSEDIIDNREELLERKYQDDNNTYQEHFNETFLEEDRGTEALSDNETSSNLFYNEEQSGEQSGDNEDNRNELSERKRKDDNDLKQGNSDETVLEEDRGTQAPDANETSSNLFDNEQQTEDNVEGKQDKSEKKSKDENHAKQLSQSKKTVNEEDGGKETAHSNETSGSLINSEKRSGDIEDDREEQSERTEFDDYDDARQGHSNETLFEEDHSTEALDSNETSSNLFDKEEESEESKDFRKELSKRKSKDARQGRSNETFFEEDHSSEALNSNETSSNLFGNEGYSAEQRQETPERKPENDEGAKQVHSKKAIHEKDHAGTEVLSVNEKLFDNEEQEHEVDNREEVSERKFKDKDKRQGRSKQPLDKEPEYWGSETLNSNERSSHFFDNEEQSGDNEDYLEKNSETLFQDDDDAKHLTRANHKNERVTKALNGIETVMDNEEQNADNVDNREKHSKTRFEDDNDAIQGHSKKEIHENIHFSKSNETSSNLSDNEDQNGDIEDDKQGKSDEKSVDKNGVKRAHSKKAITDEDDSHASLKEKRKQQKGNARKDDEIEETHDQREGKEYRGDYQRDRFFHDDDDEEEEKYDDEEPVKRQNLGMKVPLSI